MRTLQDTDQPFPNRSGLFVFPQPVQCSGTLVAITASGFCISDNANVTDIQYRMDVWLGHQTGQTNEKIRIMQMYGNCTSTSNASNYSIGTLRSAYISVDILSGDMLGVSINECNESTCPFVPIVLARGVTSMRQRRPLPPRFFGPYE